MVATSNGSTSGIVSSSEVVNLAKESCSRRNFAVKLCRKVFDEITRRRSNVSGRMGKLKLNPVMIEHIKSITFQYFPLEAYEKDNAEWARCIIAIDESYRRLNNKQKNL